MYACGGGNKGQGRKWGKKKCKVRFPKVAGSQVLSFYFIYKYKTHTRKIVHKKEKCQASLKRKQKAYNIRFSG